MLRQNTQEKKTCRTKNIFWLMIWKKYSHATSSWFEKGYCAAWLGSHVAEVWGGKQLNSVWSRAAQRWVLLLSWLSPAQGLSLCGMVPSSSVSISPPQFWKSLEMPSQIYPVGDSRSSQVDLMSDGYRRQGPHLSAPSLSTCSLILNDNGFIPSWHYWILGCCPSL